MIGFVLVFTPSVPPLRHGRVRGACTACLSRPGPRVKACRWGRPVARTAAIGSSRRSGLPWRGVRAADLFSRAASIIFQSGWLETGPGDGRRTWAPVAGTGLKPCETHVRGIRGAPARFSQENAMPVSYRDRSADAVVTGPPYYDMTGYADASDLFGVWLKPVLPGMVRRVREPGRRTPPFALVPSSQDIRRAISQALSGSGPCEVAGGNGVALAISSPGARVRYTRAEPGHVQWSRSERRSEAREIRWSLAM